jgi:diguanylate cyclase (GGDEF)-like protein
MENAIGLFIQIAGVLMIAILFFFMTRSIRRTFLDYWTGGWWCLSLSLISLGIGFRVQQIQRVSFALYYLFEYGFVFLLFAGCRNYTTGEKLRAQYLWLIPGAGLVVGLFVTLSGDFNLQFIPHAAILATLFAMAFRALRKSLAQGSKGPGLRVMLLALGLLSFDFAHYAVLFSYVRIARRGLPMRYLQYTSIYDLIFEMLLGFGAVMLVMDYALREVESANRELVAAKDRLEVLARMDPLTEALNRHAFYSLLEKRQNKEPLCVPGCAVVLDIDNLKPINDSLGHAAGDEAIRQVASSIRAVIRSDDLLFRWGGDEFLILFFSIAEAAAHARITEIDSSLAKATLPGSSSPIALIVSYGLSPFNSMAELESAIDQADSAMYARKQARKEQERRAG